MTQSEIERHKSEAASYMTTLSNAQVHGVIEVEKQRLGRCKHGDVAKVARIMLEAAKTEAMNRGII